MPTHLLIVNPAAGRGLGAKLDEEARRLLTGVGINFDARVTERPGHAREIAREAAERYKVVMILGGDGSIQETAGGLVQARMDAGPDPRTKPFAALGILPAGTGNDLIKALQFPMNLDHAVAAIAGNKTRDMDIGRLRYRIAEDRVERERFFVNNVGLGFEGQVGAEAARLTIPLRGTALYGLALAKVLRQLGNPLMHVRLADGGDLGEEKRLLVSIGNGNTCGGGFHLTPEADPFDGYLDICVVEAKRAVQIPRFIPAAMKGRHHGLKGVKILRDKAVEIASTGGFHGHADGELLGERIIWAHAEILPARLPVIL
jgi:diacylglycerol kinase (ATP)